MKKIRNYYFLLKCGFDLLKSFTTIKDEVIKSSCTPLKGVFNVGNEHETVI